MDEPKAKRAVGFFDGQNLYRHAKDAFGYHHPNFDPAKLHAAVCEAHGWRPSGIRFYTGVPAAQKSPMWHGYWANRLLAMRRSGIAVIDRPLRYRSETVDFGDGKVKVVELVQEKGIDVRLALDVVRLTYVNHLDVAVIFSQDQDLAELAKDVREIARTQNRWIKIVSAFPASPTATAQRGLDGTDWFRMDKAFYDRCLDDRDYRPRRPKV